MRWNQPSQLLLATTLVAAGCGNLSDDTTAVVSAVLGDRLPGLQGDADLLAVAHQVERQSLSLQRIMDGHVTAFDLIPFQVNKHVSQASR